MYIIYVDINHNNQIFIVKTQLVAYDWSFKGTKRWFLHTYYTANMVDIREGILQGRHTSLYKHYKGIYIRAYTLNTHRVCQMKLYELRPRVVSSHHFLDLKRIIIPQAI